MLSLNRRHCKTAEPRLNRWILIPGAHEFHQAVWRDVTGAAETGGTRGPSAGGERPRAGVAKTTSIAIAHRLSSPKVAPPHGRGPWDGRRLSVETDHQVRLP